MVVAMWERHLSIKFQQTTNPVISNLQPEDKYGILLMKPVGAQQPKHDQPIEGEDWTSGHVKESEELVLH
jgi:hypothetical protein